MKLIQELKMNTTVNNNLFASLSEVIDSHTVVWPSEFFTDRINSSDINLDDSDEILAMLLDLGLAALDSKECETLSSTEEGLVSFTFGDEEYVMTMTPNGNAMAYSRWVSDEDVYLTLGYDGTRGRFVQDLKDKGVTVEMLTAHEPTVYETTGPVYMRPYEDAYTATVREYEAGNLEPIRYWMQLGLSKELAGLQTPATFDNLVRYLKEKDESRVIKYDEMVAHIAHSRQLMANFI